MVTFNESLSFVHEPSCQPTPADVLVTLTRSRPPYPKLGVARCTACGQAGFIDVASHTQPFTVLPSTPSASAPPAG